MNRFLETGNWHFLVWGLCLVAIPTCFNFWQSGRTQEKTLKRELDLVISSQETFSESNRRTYNLVVSRKEVVEAEVAVLRQNAERFRVQGDTIKANHEELLANKKVDEYRSELNEAHLKVMQAINADQAVSSATGALSEHQASKFWYNGVALVVGIIAVIGLILTSILVRNKHVSKDNSNDEPAANTSKFSLENQ